MLVPIEDRPDWARNGSAVINVDVEAYNNHMKKKSAEEANRARIEQMESTINNLNNQVSSIHDTMNQILNLLKK